MGGKWYEGGPASLMKRTWTKKPAKQQAPTTSSKTAESLWLQMVKQTPGIVDLGIVYSSQALQRHWAKAVPATLPQSPWRRCTFDWELSRLITRWGRGFYLTASLCLLPFPLMESQKCTSEWKTNRDRRRTEMGNKRWETLPEWNCNLQKDGREEEQQMRRRSEKWKCRGMKVGRQKG